MRQLSKKRARQKRQADKEREKFRRDCPFCALCSCPMDDIHELTPGGARGVAYGERCTWLPACRTPCHDRLQAFEDPYDLAGQLALKQLIDPDHYDRERVLEIKMWSPTAVTDQEVAEARSVVEAIPGVMRAVYETRRERGE